MVDSLAVPVNQRPKDLCPHNVTGDDVPNTPLGKRKRHPLLHIFTLASAKGQPSSSLNVPSPLAKRMAQRQ